VDYELQDWMLLGTQLSILWFIYWGDVHGSIGYGCGCGVDRWQRNGFEPTNEMMLSFNDELSG
jgi:hypothetical protein